MHAGARTFAERAQMKEVLGKTERVELLVSGRHEGEDSQVA
jgi:hypothetical protein